MLMSVIYINPDLVIKSSSKFEKQNKDKQVNKHFAGRTLNSYCIVWAHLPDRK